MAESQFQKAAQLCGRLSFKISAWEQTLDPHEAKRLTEDLFASLSDEDFQMLLDLIVEIAAIHQRLLEISLRRKDGANA
jgi:hypothetical protein